MVHYVIFPPCLSQGCKPSTFLSHPPLYTRDARSPFTFVATKSLTSFGVLLPTTVDDDEVDENDVSAVMSVAWIKFSKPVSVDRTENL